jgi:hypothetical protein
MDFKLSEQEAGDFLQQPIFQNIIHQVENKFISTQLVFYVLTAGVKIVDNTLVVVEPKSVTDFINNWKMFKQRIEKYDKTSIDEHHFVKKCMEWLRKTVGSYDVEEARDEKEKYADHWIATTFNQEVCICMCSVMFLASCYSQSKIFTFGENINVCFTEDHIMFCGGDLTYETTTAEIEKDVCKRDVYPKIYDLDNLLIEWIINLQIYYKRKSKEYLRYGKSPLKRHYWTRILPVLQKAILEELYTRITENQNYNVLVILDLFSTINYRISGEMYAQMYKDIMIHIIHPTDMHITALRICASLYILSSLFIKLRKNAVQVRIDPKFMESFNYAKYHDCEIRLRDHECTIGYDKYDIDIVEFLITLVNIENNIPMQYNTVYSRVTFFDKDFVYRRGKHSMF